MKKYTETAGRVMKRAVAAAREMGHRYVGSEHILLGLVSESDSVAAAALASGGVTYEAVRASLKKSAGADAPTAVTGADLTPGAKRIIETAYRRAAPYGGVIGTEHLLFAILSEHELLAYRTIVSVGASPSAVRAGIAAPSEDRADDVIAGCPALTKYGRELVGAARRGECDPVAGREAECERVMQILNRRTKNNPCLIGDPGVGKTAIVEGLAEMIAKGDVPEALRGCLIVSLDLASMIAGAKYRGEFEERMKNVMEEARRRPEIILFIDEVHTVMGAGAADGAIDGANILKPALSRGEIRLIGATTVEEYRRHIERDAALERRFQSVTVREPTGAETVAILRALRDKYEAHHGIKISDSAIGAAVDLSTRYVADRRLPDKAIDLLDEASSRLVMEATSLTGDVREIEEKIAAAGAEKREAILAENYDAALRAKRTEAALLEDFRRIKDEKYASVKRPLTLTAMDVAETLTRRTGIPITGGADDLSRIEDVLLSRIVGQKEAVSAVSRAVKRGRAGIKDPSRPAAVLLFTGPSGVGKTECAKALAEALSGTERSLIRFDMSEYSEPHGVSKLIGSPPGYVGYGDAPRLTEAVRRAPYGVVLFDEIEKAHRDVLNVLLRIMEEGTVTDNTGRECDFRNTVMIMTSNVGAAALGGGVCLGFSTSDEDAGTDDMRRRAADGELRRVFSSEFIGRVDEVIPFRQLGAKELSAIAEKFLEKTVRLAAERKIYLEFDGAVALRIASLTDGARYGARPVRRLVTTLVEDDVADKITSGVLEKNKKYAVTYDGASLVYTEKSGQ